MINFKPVVYLFNYLYKHDIVQRESANTKSNNKITENERNPVKLKPNGLSDPAVTHLSISYSRQQSSI